jgi:Holliday junction resolvase RusA-like endonuclease
MTTAAKIAEKSPKPNRPVDLARLVDLTELLPRTDWVLDVFVPGRAAPQGSKKVFGRRVVEMSKYVDAWRTDVRAACVDVWAGQVPLDCPIVLQVEFVQRRPTSAPKRSTPSATGAPDLSKLVRSTEDAITSAGVWRDDSRIIVTLSSKRIAEIDEIPGARIRIGVPA